MFTNQSRRIWISLCLYVIAFVGLYIFRIEQVAQWRIGLILLTYLLAIVGLWLSRPIGSESRKRISDIYNDFKSGRGKATSAFQKLCIILGCALVVAITISSISIPD